ncbi:hypothetical protein Micbo1qcDRAFT_203428 [Microdochium bolleyi]|uniref:Uncharacterized protein n=1 Tax=Microdochium bolleyi TaxID=196109 RepID=A0A136J8A1_9PEZI|nr:hypothetical protein Micbo1qcDRAFT_203428 [Microdochium bolleyi]
MECYFRLLAFPVHISPSDTVSTMMAKPSHYAGILTTFATDNYTICNTSSLPVSAMTAAQLPISPSASSVSLSLLSSGLSVLFILEVLLGIYILAGIVAANVMLTNASRFDAIGVECPGNVIAEMGALVLFWPVVLPVWIAQGRRLQRLAELDLAPAAAVTVAEAVGAGNSGKERKQAETTLPERPGRPGCSGDVTSVFTATASSSDTCSRSSSTHHRRRGSSAPGAGRMRQGFWARHVPSLARMRRRY